MHFTRVGKRARLGAVASLTILSACAGGRPAVAVVPLADAPREMTADQQIHHALARLAFGARPGDYEAVRKRGLNRWIGEQLAPASIDDREADAYLQHFPLTALPETTLAQMYGAPGDLRKSGGTMPDTLAIRAADRASGAIAAQLREARVARAVLTRRQLLESMTDFWENHFSVFADKGADRYMLVAFDSTIRSHALGRFRDLLGAVAHSPAMLYYLDNSESRADSDHVTLAELTAYGRSLDARRKYETERTRLIASHASEAAIAALKPPPAYHRPVRHGRGLNENYGRELLELHTLGVDGGYSQNDVMEAARVLTGWTIRDPNHIGTFYFNPSLHDADAKTVLGVQFPAGHGEEEGERLLDLLAREPATARFIALELCRRFVSDSPSSALVTRAAERFTATDGDIAEVMRAIIGSPEFFSRAAYRAKVKSPFEVVVSTLRALDATPDTLQRAVQAVARLGEPIFGHLAPNGFPETGEEWLNAGAILNRINFGVQAASGAIPGASVTTWPPGARLASAPRNVQVDSVVAFILGGDASPQTRRILSEGTNPVAPAAAHVNDTLAAILGLALGAPEFQRR